MYLWIKINLKDFTLNYGFLCNKFYQIWTYAPHKEASQTGAFNDSSSFQASQEVPTDWFE